MSAGYEIHALSVYAADALGNAVADRTALERRAHDSAVVDSAVELGRIVAAAGLAEGVLRMLSAGMIPDLPAPEPLERKRDGRGRFMVNTPQSATAERFMRRVTSS